MQHYNGTIKYTKLFIRCTLEIPNVYYYLETNYIKCYKQVEENTLLYIEITRYEAKYNKHQI